MRAEALKDMPVEVKSPPPPPIELKKALEIKQVPGLFYRKNFINTQEESRLLSIIDKQSWSAELARRTQQFGYIYDYAAVYENEDKNAPRLLLGSKIPDWLEAICQRLLDEGYFPWKPDQIIINEYKPGQGISAHTDHAGSFREVIAAISLYSGVGMIFKNNYKKLSHEIYLEPRSLVVMENECRYNWTHEIRQDQFDVWKGSSHRRQRRVSITFRKVVDH